MPDQIQFDEISTSLNTISIEVKFCQEMLHKVHILLPNLFPKPPLEMDASDVLRFTYAILVIGDLTKK